MNAKEAIKKIRELFNAEEVKPAEPVVLETEPEEVSPVAEPEPDKFDALKAEFDSLKETVNGMVARAEKLEAENVDLKAKIAGAVEGINKTLDIVETFAVAPAEQASERPKDNFKISDPEKKQRAMQVFAEGIKMLQEKK